MLVQHVMLLCPFIHMTSLIIQKEQNRYLYDVELCLNCCTETNEDAACRILSVPYDHNLKFT